MTCDTWSENEKLESNTTPRFPTLCAGELTLSCGHKVPVLSSCVDRLARNMPVVKGFVSGQPVEVLRDTGCSGVVIQQSLVSREQCNGKRQCCGSIDGSVHTFPIANVCIDTPFFKGKNGFLL